MPETLSIHFGDHNLNDRYFVVPYDKALAILRDKTPPEDRQSRIWKLAAEEGQTEHDPRVSQLDNADLFLPWPADVLGFCPPDEWQRDLDEWLVEDED
jgi:hypothetical protein